MSGSSRSGLRIILGSTTSRSPASSPLYQSLLLQRALQARLVISCEVISTPSGVRMKHPNGVLARANHWQPRLPKTCQKKYGEKYGDRGRSYVVLVYQKAAGRYGRRHDRDGDDKGPSFIEVKVTREERRAARPIGVS